MIRARAASTSLLLVAFFGGGVEPAPALASAAAHDTTRVSYIVGGSIYLEAGSQDGLAEGDTLRVLGPGLAAGRLRVTAVSTKRAVCDRVDASSDVRVGDRVLYTPRRPAGGGPVSGGASGARSQATSRALQDSSAAVGSGRPTRLRRPLRGRLAAGFLHVTSSGGGYSRPSLDVRLEGRAAWGAPLDFVADVRGHRLYGADETHSAARVYRLSASTRGGGGARSLTVGRQLLPFASSVGLFDGMLVEMGSGPWSAGAFGGFRPAREGYEFDTGVAQGGAFVAVRGRSQARRWSLTLGGQDAHEHGVPSRAALFAQGRYATTSTWLTVAQEVDINSTWKRALGEPALSLTTTYATARTRPASFITLSGGYDNRRGALTLRDRETPETDLDDRLREGAWAGFALDADPHTRVGGNARWTSGGTAGAARSWSGSLERGDIPPLGGALRLRTTRFESEVERGWLHAGTVSIRLGGATSLAFGAGVHDRRDPITDTRRRLRWETLDADIGWRQRWYALVSAQREHGEAEDATTAYTGLSWRF